MHPERLQAIVGADGWSDDPATLAPYLSEWRDTWHGSAAMLLLPRSTEQVAAVVAECARQRVGIVPQGGNTGLCGGAIPDSSGRQVLLSLQRMNRIRSISADDYTMVAEAGCVLANVQQAAADAGRYFPLSLAAEGSCQIGGNLSTNAGGVNVLRYGTARDQVLGLEVVLADGSVVHGLRSLRKDTAGYDVKQLFIGSEGTLGIITAACLKLYPPVGPVTTAILSVATAGDSVRLLAALRERLGDRMQAYELMSARALDFVLRHVPSARSPLAGADWYVLLEAAGDGDDVARCLAACLEDGLADDASVAQSDRERDDFWRLRHSISAAQKPEGASLKHDVAVPVAAVGAFIDDASRAVTGYCDGARIVAFGHVGDGNVHFNVSQPPDWERERFLAEREPIAAIVYDVVAAHAGTFSAEHGIGVLKRDALARYRGGAELALMRRLKQALDPGNILNPGKVVPLD